VTKPDRFALIRKVVLLAREARRKPALPAAAVNKLLRETLWAASPEKDKARLAQWRSRASVGVARGGGRLELDHAVPVASSWRKLLQLKGKVTRAKIRRALAGEVAVLLTRNEHKKLAALGMARRMPKGWDRRDPLARYKAAGIPLVRNPEWRGEVA